MKGVVIFGPMGAGKTSLAQEIAKINPQAVEICGFGKPIRYHVNCFSKNPTREEYQKYGQTMRQMFGEDVWIRALDKHLHGWPEGYLPVIDDGRQENEFLWAIEKKFVTVGVLATPEIRHKRLLDRDVCEQRKFFQHETEISAINMADRCDFVFYNDECGLENVRQFAKKVMEYV